MPWLCNKTLHAYRSALNSSIIRPGDCVRDSVGNRPSKRTKPQLIVKSIKRTGVHVWTIFISRGVMRITN